MMWKVVKRSQLTIIRVTVSVAVLFLAIVFTSMAHGSATNSAASYSFSAADNIGTVIARIRVGRNPAGIAYNPFNGYIYVANSLSDTVSVIDPNTNTVVATIPVGRGPQEIAYNPSNGYLYVTHLGDHPTSMGYVSAIDPNTNKIVAKIYVDFYPSG
jgi:YVTN family beta-propeller protein